MTVAVLLFDRFTTLDVAGPYEILCRMPATEIMFVASKKGLISDPFGFTIEARHSIHDISRADILLVPGGPGIDAILRDEEITAWLMKISTDTLWTTSVCSGALLLAAAGILAGKKCTTHWRRRAQLSHYPVELVHDRVVQDGKVITSAGVSAGIDMALYLAGQIHGKDVAQQIQLNIEYDPKPPFEYPGR
jgi:transcriptional regulator GlxA family with amidase domain